MYTYLVIDDEELIRKGTIKKLESMKDVACCIGEAENGLDGIEKINALRPDIVILDMQMPYMDGMQLLPYLSQNHPEIPLIVISGFRDFDYIKQAISAQAIDYILKPFSKETIVKCMDYAISNLDKNHDIESRIVSSAQEREDACYKYDLEILNNLIHGYHTDTITLSSQKLNVMKDTHKLALATMNLTSNVPQGSFDTWIEANGYAGPVLYMPDKSVPQMGFLIFFTPQNREMHSWQLTAVLDSLVSFLRQQRAACAIGVSRVHTGLVGLHTAFLETTAALDQQPLSGAGLSCYHYQEEGPRRSLAWERQDELLFRIEAGMTGAVMDLAGELFDYFRSLPGCTLGDVKYYCYYLSDQCRLIVNLYLDQSDRKPSSNSIQNVASQIFSLDQLQEYYTQFFRNMSELLKPQSVYAVDDIIEKVQIYMQRNYQKNLTQDYIASLFYLNRSYLSSLFRAKTGEKFVDYLNSIRIEKSKELLAGTDKKMYQVAKSAGYDNVKYFFRVFKKKTGVTPEQYREQRRTL